MELLKKCHLSSTATQLTDRQSTYWPTHHVRTHRPDGGDDKWSWQRHWQRRSWRTSSLLRLSVMNQTVYAAVTTARHVRLFTPSPYSPPYNIVTARIRCAQHDYNVAHSNNGLFARSASLHYKDMSRQSCSGNQKQFQIRKSDQTISWFAWSGFQKDNISCPLSAASGTHFLPLCLGLRFYCLISSQTTFLPGGGVEENNLSSWAVEVRNLPRLFVRGRWHPCPWRMHPRICLRSK